MQNIICSQTQLDGIAHEKTIIRRQLFAGHVVGSRPTKRKKNLLRMIIRLICTLPAQFMISKSNVKLGSVHATRKYDEQKFVQFSITVSRILFVLYRVFEKFVPILYCILRKAFNASLGKCTLI